MIRNVLLDLDDTLFDFHAAEREAIIATLETLGIVANERVAARYSVINDGMWKRLERGEITRAQVKIMRFELLFGELGVACSPEAARDIYEQKLSSACPMIDGAVEFLLAAHEKYRLYLVTNGTLKVQQGRLARSGILPFFRGVFISEAVGFNKPDRRFFDSVFAFIEDFKATETVIVGDSLSSDIAGGHEVGIKTVLFDPSGKHVYGEVKPDYEVSALSELLPLFAHISGAGAEK